ncbi:MAG: type IV toxin-antitoxin system AbiEi family antitoxin domain-containing protein [Actinomycetota bacterium]|nr:type IV toxin-antitoxin system AbiEi family antitoxin domain-containing protein [Actinomycetota bacterium]
MDTTVSELAERQHGVFTLAQACAAGFTRSAILHRLSSGRWDLVGPGLYRMPGTARTWEQRLSGLVLASGPGAGASHRSAAALLGIPGFDRSGRIEAITLRPRRHRDPDYRVHRWRVLPDDHLTVVDGIRTTRVARTLVDLAGVLHPSRTGRAVDNCLAARTVTVGTLRAAFIELAQPGRKGIGVMRRLLEERGEDYEPPASELEACFLALLRRHDLPEPRRQVDAGDAAGWVGRVDFAYPQTSLLIELDSRRHHTAKLDVEADRLRDDRLRAAGWTVERFGWSDISAPDRVLLLLRETPPSTGDDPTRQDVSDRHRLVG